MEYKNNIIYIFQIEEYVAKESIRELDYTPLYIFCADMITNPGERLNEGLKSKNLSSLGGLEPPTFRLTAERANRLRHRD